MGNKKYFLCLLTLIYLVQFSISCNHTSKDIDVHKVQFSNTSIRFDKELYKADTNNIAALVETLLQKYPAFTDIYFKEITGFAKTNDSNTFYASVKHYITYKDYVGLHDTVNKYFPNTKTQDVQLLDMYKHIKYYFPKFSIGNTYYFTSGLNYWSALTVDSNIGVGLDMYLGKQYPYYESVQIPGYQIARCEKEYIPINVCKSMYENIYPINAENKNLLDLIVMRGKQLFFMEHMLPTTKEELLLGYTAEQYAWCQKNESAIWNYFKEQKLLFNTNWQDILRYVNDGPNSTGMPPECPGNIGTFIGWQIIKKYEAKTNKSLQEIIENNTLTSQQVLQESKYKP